MKTKCRKNEFSSELNIKVLPSNRTFVKGALAGLRCNHFKTTG
jgi:hypothetical protein